MPSPTKTVDIDQMIATLPRDEQVLVKKLRALVTENLPHATEKMYDDVVMPFYKRNRLICFILPSSVTLEPKSSKDVDIQSKKLKGVALGFNQGNLMSNENKALLADGRKQVYMIYFKKLQDIDDHQVCALLFEAAMIDDQFGKKSRSK